VLGLGCVFNVLGLGLCEPVQRQYVPVCVGVCIMCRGCVGNGFVCVCVGVGTL
jgi:hypothetical protein